MTTMFEAIDAFVSLVREAVPDIAEGVTDGQPTESLTTMDGFAAGVAVGWSADQDPSVVDIQPEGLDWQDRESYQIRSTLWVSYGDPAFKPLRDEAKRIFQLIQNAVKENPRLGVQGVMNSYIRFVDLDQANTEKGPSVVMQFSLAVDAFQRR
jgi:hypothetical protein